MNLEFELPKGVTRCWDLDVPIITQKNVTHAYITDVIDEPSLYNELCYLLRNASEAEYFHIHLNTPGGQLDSAFMIVDALKTTKAKTIAHLSGTVASAGTIITLACDKLEVASHTAFMVHNYSGGLAGKGHEMRARQAFTDESLSTAFADIYGNFLTEEEMNEVIDGRDMWMGTDEVIARFNGTFHTSSIDDSDPVKRKRGRPKKDA